MVLILRMIVVRLMLGVGFMFKGLKKKIMFVWNNNFNKQIKKIIMFLISLFIILLVLQIIFLISSDSIKYEGIDIVFMTIPSFFAVVFSILSAYLLDKIAEGKKEKENKKLIDNIINSIIIPELTIIFNTINLNYIIRLITPTSSYGQELSSNNFEMINFDAFRLELAKSTTQEIVILFEIYQILSHIKNNNSFARISLALQNKFIANCKEVIDKYNITLN